MHYKTGDMSLMKPKQLCQLVINTGHTLLNRPANPEPPKESNSDSYLNSHTPHHRILTKENDTPAKGF